MLRPNGAGFASLFERQVPEFPPEMPQTGLQVLTELQERLGIQRERHSTKKKQGTVTSSLLSSDTVYIYRTALSETYLSEAIERDLAFGSGRIAGPMQFFLKLLDVWRLTRDDATALLGYEPTERQTVNDLLEGRESLKGKD